MPRPRRTPEEIARMRERMLDAALELLREGGVEAISIRALTERIGVSHMVFYTYFKNHDELIHALSERQRERISQHRAELLREAEQGNVVEVMRHSLAHYSRVAERAPRVYEMLWVHPIKPVEGFDTPDKILASHLDHLSALAELGMAQGAFIPRDPFLAAATAFCIVNGPLILYHSGRITDKALRDSLVDESLAAAMRYLQGDTPQAPKSDPSSTE
ncbi:MAG: TetR/AcrR family transcriptional regulator [Chloroflexi bacterium]|nr:TetR/AcrR family transcriptional regulator [Chloroflexota bacterium]